MMRRASALLAVFAATALSPPAPLRAQPNTAAAPNPQAIVTRADLALAYLTFDRAFTEHPPLADKLGLLSQRFDQATLAFFAGRNGDAVRSIHAVIAELLAPGAPARTSAFAIRATIEPHVYRRTVGGPVTLRVVPLYALADTSGNAVTRFAVRVVSDGGRELAAATVTLDASTPLGAPIDVPLSSAAANPPRGRYRVLVTVASSGASEPPTPAPNAVPASEWFVTDDDLDAKRQDLTRRAAALDSAPSEENADAIVSFRARARMLTTNPSPANTTQWRMNPLALAQQLDLEWTTLASGADPFGRRSGDTWRVLRTKTRMIPLRTYVPVSVARSHAAAPLLIAIHGVGGDENMFPDALGQGLITKLAEQFGFVLASPNGDQFTTPEDFDRLVEQMSLQLPIDKRRIWIVGHSRGAGQAVALATSRAAQIAGVVAIAGFGRVPADAPASPMLALYGALDPLAAPARMLPLVDQAKAAGAAVEARVLPQLGHTTVVAAALPDAITWLVTRTLPPPLPNVR